MDKKTSRSSVIRKLYVWFVVLSVAAGISFPFVLKAVSDIKLNSTVWMMGIGFGVVVAVLNIVALRFLLLRPLKVVVDVAKAFSQKDMSRRCDFQSRDEIGDIVAGLNQMANDVHYSIGLVGEAATRLSDTAKRVSTVSRETDACVVNQQQATEQVATAMNEMAQTAQEMSGNAQSAMEEMVGASKEAQDGALVATEAIGGIDNLISKVQDAAAVIDGLRESSEKIGTVLDVIRGIAEQTNLLALNAAIEAARAGEQGRGFAVVADEVRTLASRTQKSTDEIQEMIEGLQNTSVAAAKVMDEVNQRGVEGSDYVERTAEALAGIAGTVAKLKTMNDQISSAVLQQQAVTEEINRDLSGISDAAEETAAGSQQTYSASEDLLRQVESLKDVVATYKL